MSDAPHDAKAHHGASTDGQSGFGFDAPAAAPAAATPYRVLARKYRPSTFDDLIGQEPMVRTLANAFSAGRIHQAYILTGVRVAGPPRAAVTFTARRNRAVLWAVCRRCPVV